MLREHNYLFACIDLNISSIYIENYIINLSLKASNFRTQTCIRVLSMNTHNTYYVLGYFARCLHHSLKIVHVSVSYYHPLLYIRLIHYRTIIELLQYRMIL